VTVHGSRQYSAGSESHITLRVWGLKSSYKRTGKAIRPKVKVSLNGRVLSSSKDYKLSYAKNKKVGKATVTVKGKGFSVSAPFKIVKK
jgi:hypothetical protein